MLEPKEPSYCKYSSYTAPYGTQVATPLDEYCSPFLFDNELARTEKSEDQVLLRVQEGDQDDGMITVSQVWLWKLGNNLIISPSLNMHVLCSWWWKEKIKTDSRPKQVGLLLSNLISLLEMPYGRISILYGFERAIIQVSEHVNEYLQVDVVENIKMEFEKDYLHQISDVREELSMIRRVLVQQEDIWKEFASSAWPNYWTTGRMAIPVKHLIKFSLPDREMWKIIMRPQDQFEKYRRRVAQLNEDAERVQGVILTKLDLKAKHASLREAHSSAIMSAAVLGFTIITVIFTPLAFVLALFALPIKHFQDHQIPSPWGDTEKPNGMYSGSYVAKATGKNQYLQKSLPC